MKVCYGSERPRIRSVGRLDKSDRVADRRRAGRDDSAKYAARSVWRVLSQRKASIPKRSRHVLQPVCGAAVTSMRALPIRS